MPVSEKNEKGASRDFMSLTSQFLFIDESSKDEIATLRIHIEIVVLETPLAVIVMVHLIDVHQNAVFEMGKIVGGCVSLMTAVI